MLHLQVGSYYTYFFYKIPLIFPWRVIKPDEFVGIIFLNQARFFLLSDPNERIWPMGSLNLATSRRIAHFPHLYWMWNDMEIIKQILFYLKHTAQYYTVSLGSLKCFLYQLICGNPPCCCLLVRTTWTPNLCFFLISFRRIRTGSSSVKFGISCRF